MTVPDKYGENNYPQAIIISVVILTAFVLLSFFWIISQGDENYGMGGTPTNYGTIEMGMGSDINSIEEPSQDPNANGLPPDKVTEESTPTDPSTSNTDEKIATSEDAEAPVVKTAKTPATATPSATTTENPKSVVNVKALYKGPKNGATGGGDGTGDKPGNQGSPNGDPNVTNYDGTGSGGTGDRLPPNRKITYAPKIEDDSQKAGVVIIVYHINRDGKVIDARQQLKGSTITDPKIVQKCLVAIRATTFSPLDDAPLEQVGMKRFVFDLN